MPLLWLYCHHGQKTTTAAKSCGAPCSRGTQAEGVGFGFSIGQCPPVHTYFSVLGFKILGFGAISWASGISETTWFCFPVAPAAAVLLVAIRSRQRPPCYWYYRYKETTLKSSLAIKINT
jgi:hypothetical protein